jgi:uncharacterized protein YcfJ
MNNKRLDVRHIGKTLVLLVFLCVFTTTGSVMSSEFFVYPNKEQSAEQLSRDKFECYEWAKQQTGIDPQQVATSVQPKKVEKRGGLFRGAARGATLGVIGGAIGGDAGKGAAIGAGVGALGGSMRRRSSEKQQLQAYDEADRQRQTLMDTFNRAYQACLEGRDYTVK